MADNEHDDIPTLGEIIFPGNPEKVARHKAHTQAQKPEPAPQESPSAPASPRPTIHKQPQHQEPPTEAPVTSKL